MTEPDLELAHKLSSHNRQRIAQSEVCGCFYCLAVFTPAEIKEWVDDDDTPLCPKCGVDSVLGSSSGFPITTEFLHKMKVRWFGGWGIRALITGLIDRWRTRVK